MTPGHRPFHRMRKPKGGARETVTPLSFWENVLYLSDRIGSQIEQAMALPGQKPTFTDEERTEIVEQICLMYETQRCTLASAAEAAGISVRTFFLWRGQYSEYSERYKRAKKIQRAAYWEDVIQPLQESALERLLTGGTTTDKKTKGERNAAGEFVVTEQVVVERMNLPNAAVAIFVTKGLNPEMFVERQEVKTDLTVNDDSWFTKLPLEKRIAILEIVNAAGHTDDQPVPSAQS